MGSGCGKKSGNATPPQPRRDVPTPQEEELTVTLPLPGDIPSDTSSDKATDGGSTTSLKTSIHVPQEAYSAEALEFATAKAPTLAHDAFSSLHVRPKSEATGVLDETRPPTALPRLSPSMSLPIWLKLVIKPEPGVAVDQLILLEAYHNVSEPPHLENEAFIKIVLKVFGDARELVDGGSLWLAHVRWITASEAADVFEAGYKSGDPLAVSAIVRKSAQRVMDSLHTATDSNLPIKQSSNGAPNGEVAAGFPSAITPCSCADYAAPIVSPPPPPPFPPPAEPPAAGVASTTVEKVLAARPQWDYSREFETVKTSASYEILATWLKEVFSEHASSFADPIDAGLAFSTLQATTGETSSIDTEIMARAMADVFPQVKVGPVPDDVATAFFVGLKWTKLESPAFSGALPYPTFPEKRRNEVGFVPVLSPKDKQLTSTTGPQASACA